MRPPPCTVPSGWEKFREARSGVGPYRSGGGDGFVEKGTGNLFLSDD